MPTLPYTALYAWALRWSAAPDTPTGPLEATAGDYTAKMARAPFVRAVIAHCPTAVGALLDELPSAVEALRDEWRGGSRDEGATVGAWAARYGITERWFVSAMLIHSRFVRVGLASEGGWRRSPEPTDLIKALDSGELYRGLVFDTSEPKEAPDFFAFHDLQAVLEPVGANPHGESLEEFLLRARQHYHARTSLLLALGAKPAATVTGPTSRRSRRAAGKPSLHDHCQWLALYQFEGHNMAQIARDARRGDRSTISKAVHGLATLLNVSLR